MSTKAIIDRRAIKDRQIKATLKNLKYVAAFVVHINETFTLYQRRNVSEKEFQGSHGLHIE